MKILLINSNPVVSRLTALSARKEEIQIDEVQEVNEVNNSHYDIVFVDADSWNKDVDSAISKNIQTQKRVLFYAQDDKSSKDLFDISILKPFLPSEVSAVIRLVEESGSSTSNETKVEEKNFEILETSKSEQKDDFLRSLNDDLNFEEKVTTLVEDKPVELKTKVDKRDEDIFAELKDDSKTFDEQLEEAFPLKKSELESEALFELDLSDSDKLENSSVALEKEKKSETKAENSDLFDFDLDSGNELDLNLDIVEKAKEKKIVEPKRITVDKKETIEPKKVEKKSEKRVELVSEKPKKIESKEIKPKIETKILDENELSTIKDILNNEESTTMELDELMTTQPATVNLVESSKKEKKRKSKKVKVSSEVGSEVLADTLASLPIETLRGLLAGANIKISIKFPKDK